MTWAVIAVHDDDDRFVEAHVIPESDRPHDEHPDCWCEPWKDLEDEMPDHPIWHHREV